MLNEIKDYFTFCWEFYQNHPFLTGIVVTLLGVLILSLIAEGILICRRAGKVKFLSFETENGKVNVSLRSMEGLVRVIGNKDFSEFNLGNVSLLRRKQNVVLFVSVEYVCGNRTLPVAAQAFEARILKDLKDVLGITDISKVVLNVRNSRSAEDDNADVSAASAEIPLDMQ